MDPTELVDNQAQRLGIQLSNAQRDALVKNYGYYLTRVQGDHELDAKTCNGYPCDDLRQLPHPKWTERNPAEFAKLKLSDDPEERMKGYMMVERERGEHLARIIHRTVESLPDLPHGERIDMGYRSGAVLTKLNALEDQEDIEWHGLDLQSTIGRLYYEYGDCMRKLREDERTFRQYDGARMPYEDGSVSVMSMNMVLHHVESDVKLSNGKTPMDHYLDECYRVLATNGRLVIMEDYIGDDREEIPFYDVVKHTDSTFYPHAPGEQRPTIKWCKLLEEHGFEIEITQKYAGYNTAGFPVIEQQIVAKKPAE